MNRLTEYIKSERQSIDAIRKDRMRRSVQFFTVLSLVSTLSFLVARTIWFFPPGLPLPTFFLFALDVHGLLSFAWLATSAWRTSPLMPPKPMTMPEGRTAILIPTYSESRELLIPCLAAAAEVKGAARRIILDDGDRDWVKDFSSHFGFEYKTRKKGANGKAGNLNSALPVLDDIDFILVIDADHVVKENILERTLPYFSLSDIAAVMTPQDYYNLDSFTHFVTNRDGRRVMHGEENFFYRVMMPGRNYSNSAFSCGTGVVYRMKAIRAIHGFFEKGALEDLPTSLTLINHGWRIVFHNELLSLGISTETPERYLIQRYRWAVGALQQLRMQSPFNPKLKFRSFWQRSSMAHAICGWLDSWRQLGYHLLLIGVGLFNWNPMGEHYWIYTSLLAVDLSFRFLSLYTMGRGYFRWIPFIALDHIRLESSLRATWAIFKNPKFKSLVTPKNPQTKGAEIPPWPKPRILLALLGLELASVVRLGFVIWNGYTAPGSIDLGFGALAFFWLAFHIGSLVLSIQWMSQWRFRVPGVHSFDLNTSAKIWKDSPSGRIGEPIVATTRSISMSGIELGEFGALPKGHSRFQIELPEYGLLLKGFLLEDEMAMPGTLFFTWNPSDFYGLHELSLFIFRNCGFLEARDRNKAREAKVA